MREAGKWIGKALLKPIRRRHPSNDVFPVPLAPVSNHTPRRGISNSRFDMCRRFFIVILRGIGYFLWSP